MRSEPARSTRCILAHRCPPPPPPPLAPSSAPPAAASPCPPPPPWGAFDARPWLHRLGCSTKIVKMACDRLRSQFAGAQIRTSMRETRICTLLPRPRISSARRKSVSSTRGVMPGSSAPPPSKPVPIVYVFPDPPPPPPPTPSPPPAPKPQPQPQPHPKHKCKLGREVKRKPERKPEPSPRLTDSVRQLAVGGGSSQLGVGGHMPWSRQ
eukprot:jgi/Mesen1/5676/ME000288S04881